MPFCNNIVDVDIHITFEPICEKTFPYTYLNTNPTAIIISVPPSNIVCTARILPDKRTAGNLNIGIGIVRYIQPRTALPVKTPPEMFSFAFGLLYQMPS